MTTVPPLFGHHYPALPVIVASSAVVFGLIASGIALFHMFRHVRYNTEEHVRRYIVRILLMVPICSLDAAVSLLVGSSDQDFVEMLMVIRDLYEAVVVISFLQLLMAYLGGPIRLAYEMSLDFKEDPESITHRTQHMPPLHLCMRRWVPGPDFVHKTLSGVHQYVPVNIVLTLLALLAWLLDVYKNYQHMWLGAATYIVVIRSLSQAWALYNLVMFYHCFHERLRPINPLPKFLCVKGILFFTFWQSVIIGLLLRSGYLENTAVAFNPSKWNSHEIAAGIQNYFMSLEMVGFAIAHMFAYPYDEFVKMAYFHQTGSSTMVGVTTEGGDTQIQQGQMPPPIRQQQTHPSSSIKKPTKPPELTVEE
eukprot:Filipodium_phascolosomae@DN5790_c0_g1_i1.p1